MPRAVAPVAPAASSSGSGSSLCRTDSTRPCCSTSCSTSLQRQQQQRRPPAAGLDRRTGAGLAAWRTSNSSSSRRCRGRRRHATVALAEGEEVISLQESLTFGRWRVRKIRQADIPAVAAIQGDSFADPFPVPGMEGLQRQAFKGEVLSILRRKLANCASDSFACLVVEPADGDGGVLGCVELSLEDDSSVLRTLGRGEPYYAYVSCMAVRPAARRRGLATVLLQAAERLAGRWHERSVILHVYEDNQAAVQLYRSRGYGVISTDPGWKRLLPGARVRLLMERRM